MGGRLGADVLGALEAELRQIETGEQVLARSQKDRGDGDVHLVDQSGREVLGRLTGEVLSASRHTLFFSLGRDLPARFTIGVRGTALAMDPINVVASPFIGWRIGERAAVDVSGTLPIGSRRGVIGNSEPGALLWLKLEAGSVGGRR